MVLKRLEQTLSYISYFKIVFLSLKSSLDNTRNTSGTRTSTLSAAKNESHTAIVRSFDLIAVCSMKKLFYGLSGLSNSWRKLG